MKTRTLMVNVNFGMTVIAGAKLFEVLARSRDEARNASPEALAELDKGDLYRHSLMVSDKTDEEVLNQVLRMATREVLREELSVGLTGDGLRAKMGDVKVTVAPKNHKRLIENAAINCIQCRVLANAGRTYKCAACRSAEEVS